MINLHLIAPVQTIQEVINKHYSSEGTLKVTRFDDTYSSARYFYANNYSGDIDYIMVFEYVDIGSSGLLALIKALPLNLRAKTIVILLKENNSGLHESLKELGIEFIFYSEQKFKKADLINWLHPVFSTKDETIYTVNVQSETGNVAQEEKITTLPGQEGTGETVKDVVHGACAENSDNDNIEEENPVKGIIYESIPEVLDKKEALQQDFSELNQKKISLENDINELSDKLYSINDSIAAQNKVLSNLQSDSNDLSESNVKLSAEVFELKESKTNLENEIIKLKAEFEDIKTKINNLKNDIQSSNKILNELEVKKADIETLIDSKKAELSQVEIIIQDNKDKLALIIEEIAVKNGEFEALKSDIQEKSNELVLEAQRLSENRIKELNNSVDVFKEESQKVMDELDSRKTLLERELESIENVVENKRRSIVEEAENKAKRDIEGINKDVLIKRGTLDSLNETLIKKYNEIEEKEGVVEALEQDIEELIKTKEAVVNLDSIPVNPVSIQTDYKELIRNSVNNRIVIDRVGSKKMKRNKQNGGEGVDKFVGFIINLFKFGFIPVILIVLVYFFFFK